jgi:hypothetical protein
VSENRIYALHNDVDILLVEKIGDNSLRVKVRGPKTGILFTFVYDNGEWKLHS